MLFDDPRKIQNLIKNYLDYQYEVNHLVPKTVQSYYDGIKHFYQSNEIMLNWYIMKDYVGSNVNVSANLDMPYTYEEIHKMLDKSDERKRVVVYLFSSVGVRIGAIPELKIGDLKWIEQYGIYEITVYNGFPESYTAYCSMECASAINSYLEFRKRCGEKISTNSYLIRKQFDKQNTREHLKKVSDANDPPEKHRISKADIQYIIYHLIYDSGIRSIDEKKTRLGDRHRNMASHSFRKFFENKCLESGVDPFYVSVLMGHKAGIGVERHYYRPTAINGDNSLLSLYVNKAMPFLTISEESRLRLKNRELEMKMKDDEERIKKALAIEERYSRQNEKLTELAKRFQMMEEKLKKEGMEIS